MQPTDPEQELRALNSRLIMVNIIDAPAMVLIGLGLFAKLSDDPGSLHPIFADSTATTGMLVVGVAIAAWSAIQIFSIVRRRNEIQRRRNS